jgi:2-phosphosulfolactate phosphatase
VRVHVAFTADEQAVAPIEVVVDVVRASSTICQTLAVGTPRVYCCLEIEEALELKRELGEGLTGGERNAVRVEGFDLGASPRDYLEPLAEPLILSTTNGTRAILEAAAGADEVYVGSLLNLDAVTRAVREAGRDVVVRCAGFKGTFALDDAYCAGRIVQALDAERTDAAIAAELVARSFADPLTALNARTYGPPGLEQDVEFCAQESILDVVPRYAGRAGAAAVIERSER